MEKILQELLKGQLNIQEQLAEIKDSLSTISQGTTRNNDDITVLKAKIEALNTRLFKQESELISLKKQLSNNS